MRIVALATLVAALSLLLMRTPDFDPTAWLIWGEQLSGGELHTLGGPSWKPLPVLFTTPFAFAGDTGAEWLWLIVARVGGMLGIVMAFLVARRLGGRTAGWIAAAGMTLATSFIFNFARGDAEGLLVLTGLGAVWLHLEGRREAALVAGVAAGLIRPEVWPLLALYGLWLMRSRRDARSVLVVVGLGLLVVAAWLVPERAGSGDWFRAATRAQTPAASSPGQSAFPFGAVFVNSSIAVPWPLYAGGLWAVWVGWRERDRTVLGLAAAATLLMLIVAAMAQAGFTGSLRYVTLPAAIVCVLGGIGLPALAGRVPRPALLIGAAGALAAVLASSYLLFRNAEDLADEGRIYGRQLPQVIERAGGAEAIARCGPVGASHFASQMVARRLGLLQEQVRRGPDITQGTIFALRRTGAARMGAVPERFRLGGWVLRSTCGGPGGAGPPQESPG